MSRLQCCSESSFNTRITHEILLTFFIMLISTKFKPPNLRGWKQILLLNLGFFPDHKNFQIISLISFICLSSIVFISKAYSNLETPTLRMMWVLPVKDRSLDLQMFKVVCILSMSFPQRLLFFLSLPPTGTPKAFSGPGVNSISLIFGQQRFNVNG